MLRRVSTSFAAQIWALFLALADRLILVAVLLRFWGTDLYADWAIIFAAANLISMGELGLNVYLGNAWQRAFAHKDEVQFQRLVSVSLTIYLGLTAILMVTAFPAAFAVDLGNRLSLQIVDGNTAIQILAILIVAFALRILRGSISQIYRGRGHFAAGTIVNSLSTAALIIAVVMAALLGGSPVHVALTYLAVDSIFGLGIMLYDLKRRFPHLRFSPQVPDSAELIDMTGHGKWYAVLQAAPIAWLQVPVLMIAGLGLGGLAVVSFVVLRTLVNFARQIPEMLARSVGVETAGDFHLGDKDRLWRIFKVFGPFLSALTGAFAGGLFVFAAPFTALWTGRPEAYNAWIVFWLLAPVIMVAPATPLRNLLTLGNVPRPVALAQMAQL
ncbi:MAG: hypothetical protein OER56_13860, partial [Hyphomicrobiales bacterium]|nr:hypothetical protein [Hyphomicrobiales bacterium]